MEEFVQTTRERLQAISKDFDSLNKEEIVGGDRHYLKKVMMGVYDAAFFIEWVEGTKNDN